MSGEAKPDTGSRIISRLKLRPQEELEGLLEKRLAEMEAERQTRWDRAAEIRAKAQMPATLEPILDDQDLYRAVYHVWRLILRKIEVSGEASLSREQQVFSCVYLLDKEVHDGGFDSYFFNSSGDTAYAVVSALSEIGAEDCVPIVKEALSIFPGGVAPRDEGERWQYLPKDGHNETARMLDRLDHAYYQGQNDLYNLLMKYVRHNRAAFE